VQVTAHLRLSEAGTRWSTPTIDVATSAWLTGSFPRSPLMEVPGKEMCTHIHLEAPESPPLAGSRDSYLGYSARSTWKRSW
jgi:hypothetical protein